MKSDLDWFRKEGYGPRQLTRTIKFTKGIDLGSSGAGLPPVIITECRHDQVAGLRDLVLRKKLEGTNGTESC